MRASLGICYHSKSENMPTRSHGPDFRERRLGFQSDPRLRETLLILHQSWFFEGDVHHTKEEQEAEGKSA